MSLIMYKIQYTHCIGASTMPHRSSSWCWHIYYANTMLRNPNNSLYVRGKEYFVGMEITGSAKQKDDKKKFPMLDFFENTLLPKLDAKAEELSQKPN